LGLLRTAAINQKINKMDPTMKKGMPIKERIVIDRAWTPERRETRLGRRE
jgi:hypothetical protein